MWKMEVKRQTFHSITIWPSINDSSTKVSFLFLFCFVLFCCVFFVGEGGGMGWERKLVT